MDSSGYSASGKGFERSSYRVGLKLFIAVPTRSAIPLSDIIYLPEVLIILSLDITEQTY
jgi:hypothetical protein